MFVLTDLSDEAGIGITIRLSSPYSEFSPQEPKVEAFIGDIFGLFEERPHYKFDEESGDIRISLRDKGKVCASVILKSEIFNVQVIKEYGVENWEKLRDGFIKAFIERFSFSFFQLDEISIQYEFTWEIGINQNKIISEAFFKDSDWAKLLSGFEPAGLEFKWSLLLDREKAILAMFGLHPNTVTSEVLKDNYPPDDKFKGGLAIGRVELKKDVPLQQQIDELLVTADTFIEKRYVPIILKPIKETIERLRKNVE